jgi:hypothetical protein
MPLNHIRYNKNFISKVIKMFNLKIDFSQFEKFAENLWKIDINKISHEGLIKSITYAEREWKIASPVRTGRLRKSYLTKVEWLTATLYNNVEYFTMVHWWTKPYIINPKSKKALYWKGWEYPVKKVQHPWIKANPIYERIEEKVKDKVVIIMNDEFWTFLNTLIA